MRRADPSSPLDFSYAKSIVELFSERVLLAPDSIALRDDTGTWTYQALSAASDSVGHHLLAGGVQKGSIVAIYASRAESRPSDSRRMEGGRRIRHSRLFIPSPALGRSGFFGGR